MILIFRSTESNYPGLGLTSQEKRILKDLRERSPEGISVAALAENYNQSVLAMQDSMWKLARQNLVLSEYI